jgi:arginase
VALIASGLLEQLREDLDYDVHYDQMVHSYTDIIPASDSEYRKMKKPRAVSAVTQHLSQQVYEHAKQGKFVLTLGGDHSIAIGSISGIAKAIRERLEGRELAVVWVDAHADINTPEISQSGNIHGMPVAFLTGLAKEENKDIFGWLEKEHLISVSKLVYIGLRDVERGEKKLLREHSIKAFSMHDIDRYTRSVHWFRQQVLTVSQARDWTSGRDGPSSHRQRHADSSVLRCRCSRPAMGTQHWHSGTRRLDTP